MITHHAIQRTQERAGIKSKSSEKFIANALERGRMAEVFSANERNYLQAKEAKGECCVIVYQDFLFIVNDADCCVTVYAAPRWFGKKNHYDGKTKIRNIKKYMRLNNVFDEFVA